MLSVGLGGASRVTKYSSLRVSANFRKKAFLVKKPKGFPAKTIGLTSHSAVQYVPSLQQRLRVRLSLQVAEEIRERFLESSERRAELA